jgi:hypothetical protein
VSGRRGEWLDHLACACEEILDDDDGDPKLATLMADTRELLARIHEERDAPPPVP